jgi:hypothetical protein
MRYSKVSLRRLFAAAMLCLSLFAVPRQAQGQAPTPGIDFFAGVSFNFRDVYYRRQYDFLINITPGFRWAMGHDWQLTGQVYVPIVNQYEEYGNNFKINNFALSKQLHVGPLYCKATAGLFSLNRYGLDVKLFLPVASWFAFEAQGGYVGWLNTDTYWRITAPDRFVGTVGGDIYLSRWNTQLRGVVGLYLYKDFGFEAEAMRHFNHSTISVYAHWSNLYKYDVGFKIIAMIPPYHRTRRAVNIRPASNFRLTYSIMTNIEGNRMYKTDPEENERDGWFDRHVLPWGSHTMEPDFIINQKITEE